MPKMATLQVPSVPTTPEAGMFAVRIPSFKTANAPQMGTGFTSAKPPRPRSTDDSIMMNRVATTLDKACSNTLASLWQQLRHWPQFETTMAPLL